MGKEDGPRIMKIIMQEVSRKGKYELEIRDNPTPNDLMANRMVQYKILQRKVVKYFPKKADCYEYTEGENFAVANLKGAHEFIDQEDKRLNPNQVRRFFANIDRSNIISAVIGGVIVWLIGLIFG